MDIEELRKGIQTYLQVLIKEKINIREYALKNNIPIYVNGNMDKGWKGNAVEHMLNLKKNSKKGADYLGLEVKTVPILIKDNQYKVKETTCLSVLDTNEVIKHSFEKSSLFDKIQNTLFILINVTDEENPLLEATYHLNLNDEPYLKKKMEEDYNTLAEHILDNIQEDLPLDNNFTGKLGEVIQPRPKTGKKGNYTWAFYLKTHVLTNLLKDAKLIPNKVQKIKKL